MRNSLKYYREQKKLTQAQLGERTGFRPQTVASYEQYTRPLPEEFARKAAIALGVSEETLNSEPPTMGEETPPYRTSALALDFLPTDLLWRMREIFSDRFKSSHEPAATRIMHSLFALNEELKRRPDLIKHTAKPAPGAGGLSSAEVSQLATSSSAALERVLPSGDEGSERPHGAGEQPAHKAEPRAPSAPASKPPRSGHGGKVQK